MLITHSWKFVYTVFNHFFSIYTRVFEHYHQSSSWIVDSFFHRFMEMCPRNNENPVGFHQKDQNQYHVLTVVSQNDAMHQQSSFLKKIFSSLVRLGKLELGGNHLVNCMTLQNSPSWFV